MILEEAWGGSFEADISSEGGISYGHLDEDEELFSYNSDYGYQNSDSVNMSGEDYGPESDDDESMRDDSSVSSSNQGQRHRRRFRRVRSESEDPSALVNALPLQLGPMDSACTDQPSPISSLQEEGATNLSIERLNVRVRQQLRVQDRSGHGHEMGSRETVKLSSGLVSVGGMGEEKGDENRADDEGAEALSDDGEDGESDSSVGTDGSLPELAVTFADPEGSHFKELLYWVSIFLTHIRTTPSSPFVFLLHYLRRTFSFPFFFHPTKTTDNRKSNHKRECVSAEERGNRLLTLFILYLFLFIPSLLAWSIQIALHGRQQSVDSIFHARELWCDLAEHPSSEHCDERGTRYL